MSSWQLYPFSLFRHLFSKEEENNIEFLVTDSTHLLLQANHLSEQPMKGPDGDLALEKGIVSDFGKKDVSNTFKLGAKPIDKTNASNEITLDNKISI